MKSARVAALVLTVFGASARLTVGCAESADASDPLDAAVAEDSDVRTPAADSSVTDSGDADARRSCSADGWCHTTLPIGAILDASAADPAAFSIGLRDVWVADDHAAWAVAQQGYVLRWKAGAWELVTDTRRRLRSVWAPSADDVWVAGDEGILHGTMKDGTFTLEKVPVDATEPIVRIRGTSPNDLWAVTRTAIYHKAGASFARVAFPNGIADPTATQQITDLWVRGQETWIGGQEYTDCVPDEPPCRYESRMLLLRWKGGVDAADASPLASWDRVPIPYRPTEQLGSIANGALSPDGTHFVAFLGWSNTSAVGRISAGGAGIADASALDDAGMYAWSLAAPAPSGTIPEGVWAASSQKAWLIASPGTVRHWDGESWKLTRISITTSPLAKALHGIGGIVDRDGRSDAWIVGDDVAMHRSELP